MRRRRGPLIRAPEFEGRGGFLSILCPAARLAKIRPVSGSLLLNSMADKETYEKWGKILFGVPGPGLFRHIAPGLLTQLCVRFGPPGNFWKNVPLSGYLNGFGLAVSWTRLGRVRLSRIRNLCLKGTPSTGRKSLATLRPSLGVKRSEKWRAHVRIFLEYFCFIFFKGLPEHWVLWPFSMWQVKGPTVKHSKPLGPGPNMTAVFNEV